MFEAFRLPISWRELAVRTYNESTADNVLGLAAQLVYLLPARARPGHRVLVALTSFFPPGIIDRMIQSAAGVMPSDMLSILQDQMEAIRGREQGGTSASDC